MRKLGFLTPEFYENQSWTLLALNLMVDHVSDHEFRPGKIVDFLCVHDNSFTRKTLSSIISDMDGYIIYNESRFSDLPGEIMLSALLEHYQNVFNGKGGEIIMDNALRFRFYSPPGSTTRILNNEDLADMEANAILKGEYVPPIQTSPLLCASAVSKSKIINPQSDISHA